MKFLFKLCIFLCIAFYCLLQDVISFINVFYLFVLFCFSFIAAILLNEIGRRACHTNKKVIKQIYFSCLEKYLPYLCSVESKRGNKALIYKNSK